MNQAFRFFTGLRVIGSDVFDGESLLGGFSTDTAALQVGCLLQNPYWTPTRDFVLSREDWNTCRDIGQYVGTGYFVDQNGHACSVQEPGHSKTVMINVSDASVVVLHGYDQEEFTAKLHKNLDEITIICPHHSSLPAAISE